MKKILLCLLITASVFCIFACNKKDNSEITETTTALLTTATDNATKPIPTETVTDVITSTDDKSANTPGTTIYTESTSEKLSPNTPQGGIYMEWTDEYDPFDEE